MVKNFTQSRQGAKENVFKPQRHEEHEEESALLQTALEIGFLVSFVPSWFNLFFLAA